jgi:hypothetical protein
MMTYPGEAGDGGGGVTSRTSSGHSSADVNSMSLDQLRVELNALRERERQIAELLGAKSTDKIVHDLRNLLNEVQLLRILAEQGNA